ncbi:MAG: GTP-binding protein, partial [Magnetococcales bacterium]|nr:GTP-binding protein [Magnetococcales bacterium]
MSTEIGNIRNVVLLSHGGGGKTTLAESLLFNGQAIRQRGVVEKGTTVMSTEPEEVARGITVQLHVGHCHWKGCLVNLVDTPGYIDFLETTRAALDVVGGAVMLFSGVMGVKTENERLWEMAKVANLPALAFVNKMDQPRADFIRTLGDIEQSLGVVALPVTYPIGSGEDFLGIVDLLPMTAWSAKDGQFTQIDLPDSV